MKTVVVEAVGVLHFISPADDPASEFFVVATVLDNIPSVVHLVKGVLSPLVIYEHGICFALG